MTSQSLTRPLKLVAVSGAPHAPSKTEALLDTIIARLKQHLHVDIEYVKLSEIGHLFTGVAQRHLLAPEIQDALNKIETADALLVASPIYRASYTGLFKHLFDFIDQFALVDKPVLLAATGGSERHALVLDHQFRPLFSFFQAQTLPIGVFATDKDFERYQVTNPALLERIELAVTRAVPQFLFVSQVAVSAESAAELQAENIKLNQLIKSKSPDALIRHVQNIVSTVN